MTEIVPTAPEPAPPSAPRPLSALTDGEWHRLHPLTPLFRGGFFLVVMIGIVIANLRDRIFAVVLPWIVPDIPDEEFEDWESGDPIDWILANNLILVAVLAVLAIALLLVAWFYVSWRFHTFRITGDDVEVRSGILFRTHRRAPLDRVQGVNLTRPLFARLCGMAKLEVVGAGLDSNVKLDYLSTSSAEQVRADILLLASGRRLASRSGQADRGSLGTVVAATVTDGISGIIAGAEEPVDEPASVVSIPIGRLIASHVLSPATVGLVIAIIAVIVGSVTATPWLIFGLVPAIIGFGAYWVSQIVKSLRYSIAPTSNGVRITFGLFTTITEIVPPGRIHAIEIGQSILWRPFGWWRVRINRITGRSATDTATDQFTRVLPVGTRDDVERVLRLLIPERAPEDLALLFEHGILGPRPDDPYTNTPRRAWWLRPFSWKRNGFALSADALLVRRGVVWRNVAVLPYARLQSLALHQGPVDRALAIASAQAHTVTGPVSGALGAIDRDAALGLFDEVTRRAVAAGAADRTHRWAGSEP